MILVTGASGNVGRIVVELLLDAGERVRAMTRDPRAARFPAAVETVRGDLAEPASLAAALDGVRRMYLFPVPATAHEVAGKAARAGVRRVVVLSSGAVTAGVDAHFHRPVERAVEASGLEWTHVRPGEFMLNKLWLWGPSIRTENVVYEPFPDLAWCPVHERDIAEVAVAALLGDGHQGRAYDLRGPQYLSRRDQVRAIAGAIGREVRLEVVTRERAREMYRRQGGFAAANADFLLGYHDYSGNEAAGNEAAGNEAAGNGAAGNEVAGNEAARDGSAGNDAVEDGAAGDRAGSRASGVRDPLPTAQRVTGRPARTFARWARDHAADFGA